LFTGTGNNGSHNFAVRAMLDRCGKANERSCG
jgi:hypothetical protein